MKGFDSLTLDLKRRSEGNSYVGGKANAKGIDSKRYFGFLSGSYFKGDALVQMHVEASGFGRMP